LDAAESDRGGVAPLPPIRPVFVADRVDRAKERDASDRTGSVRAVRAPVRQAPAAAAAPARPPRLDLIAIAFAPQAVWPTRFARSIAEPAATGFAGRAVEPLPIVASAR
jgi:hypothetical protein